MHGELEKHTRKQWFSRCAPPAAIASGGNLTANAKFFIPSQGGKPFLMNVSVRPAPLRTAVHPLNLVITVGRRIACARPQNATAAWEGGRTDRNVHPNPLF